MECETSTVVTAGPLGGGTAPWPRLESDARPISAGSARPLEDAFPIPQLDLVR